MSSQTATSTPLEVIAPRRLRADVPQVGLVFAPDRLLKIAAVVVIASFALIGAGRLDLGPIESRLGLASGDRIGPFGLVYGSWEPGLLPGRVIPSRIWAWFYGGATATAAAIRWPEAIAAALIALVASRRLGATLGPRASVLAALTAAGSIAMIDRSTSGLGLLDGAIAWLSFGLTGSQGLMLKPILPDVNLIAGLFVILRWSGFEAGDRTSGSVFCRESPRWRAAGRCWRRLPFLRWYSVIGTGRNRQRRFSGADRAAWLVALGVVDRPVRGLGRVGRAAVDERAGLDARSLGPGVRLAVVSPDGPGRVPIGPRRLERGRPIAGHGLAEDRRALALAGTLIPGLGDSARVPILFGLAIASAAGLDRVLGGWSELSKGAKRAFWGSSVLVAIAWASLAIPSFGYVSAAIGAYRSLAIGLIAIGISAPVIALIGRSRSRPAMGLVALVIVAGALKLAHWGVVVPEWNYRESQGPWGRAIGQWIPRRATLYFINTTAFDDTIPDRDRWPSDLAFHTGRRVRQLSAPAALDLEPQGPSPHFVLLHPSEFEHWPKAAPPLVLVRKMQDRYGEPRVLARTEGPIYPDRRQELGE